MECLPFQTLEGKYAIVEELGRGASGICYHIITKENGQHYALKKIPLSIIEPCELHNQIKILSSIYHPNIIQLRRSYVSKQFLYLLFDYNQEKDLQKIIKQRQKGHDYFEETVIWTFLNQMLIALQYLHERKIIHRDIKPSNIFVNMKEMSLQIGDLGTAKISENENYSRIGTPLYLPPEIIKYESYSEKVDVWSLGVTIFQMAALKHPFQGQNFIKLAQQITYEEPTYPSHFSKKLTSCLKMMLKKNSTQRPSCSQLLDTFFAKSNSETQSNEESRKSNHYFNEVEYEKIEQDEWKVEVISGIFLESGMCQDKLGSEMSLFKRNNVLDDNSCIVKRSSMSSMNQASHKKLVSYHEDEVKELSHISHLQDNDHTIVLKVDPNDFNNFSGYYRESPRPSRVHFNSQGTGINVLKMGRKSSLFKQTQGNDSCSQPFSHFKANFNNKENEKQKKKTINHKRQESGICNKTRHEQMMSNLKPLKNEKEIQKKRYTKQVDKPELIIIDKK